MRPRPLFSVFAPQHRDLAIANDILDGRFTLLGTTVTMPRPFDWRAVSLPDDDEWRVLWQKFYWGLDLAHAYRVTGDRRYFDTWQELVTTFIEQVGFDDASDVLGRRIANWIYAWDRFDDEPRDAKTIYDAIATQVDTLLADLSPARNHRTLELTSLFIAFVAFPRLDSDGSRLAFAIEELDRNLRGDFYDDGVHREQSTHYQMEVLRNFAAVRENARRHSIALPLGFDEHLARAATFALHVHRPDRQIAAFSDADTGDYRHLLPYLPDVLHRERNADFPTGGYFTQRSDWSASARYLLFDCGPLGDGGHGHYDALHVEIAANGRPLLVDPGRYVYREEGETNWRRWFRGTAAHNTVTIDGLDQTPYTKSSPRPATVARARFHGRTRGEQVDLLAGEVHSSAYAAVHAREIAFVENEYWIITDRVRDEVAHRAELRWHFTSEAQQRTHVEQIGDAFRVVAPGVTLLVFGAQEARLEDGWVAPSYGIKHPAPVAVLTAHGSAIDFVTIVTPTAARVVFVPSWHCAWPEDADTTREDAVVVAYGSVPELTNARALVLVTPSFEPTRDDRFAGALELHLLEDTLRALRNRFFSRRTRIEQPQLVARWEARVHAHGVDAIRAQLRDRRELPESLDVPVLLIAGADDPRLDRAALDALAQRWNAQLVVIENAGALPMLERPDAVRAAIDAFVTSLA